MHPGCEPMCCLYVCQAFMWLAMEPPISMTGDAITEAKVMPLLSCAHPTPCRPSRLYPSPPLSPLTPHPLPLTPHSVCTTLRWRSSPKWPPSASTRLRSSSANSAGAATTCDRRAPVLLPLPATAPLPQHTSTSGTATRAATMTTTRCRRDRAARPSPRSFCRSAAPVKGLW